MTVLPHGNVVSGYVVQAVEYVGVWGRYLLVTFEAWGNIVSSMSSKWGANVPRWGDLAPVRLYAVEVYPFRYTCKSRACKNRANTH